MLGRDVLERYLGTDDLKSVLQELMHTEYADDLEEALIHGRGAHEVDAGLRKNLVRTYRKILGFLNDEAYEICSTLLGRWDVFNVKTILRGKHMHLSDREIEDALLPVGVLSTVDLAGLLSATDMRGVVDLANTWGLPHSAAMRVGYAEYQRTAALADLEVPIDRHYAAWASDRLDRPGENYALGRWVLGTQIDNLNLGTVFRAARENLDPGQSEKYFLTGGRDIDLEKYQRLAIMSDVDQILDVLHGTRYGKVLDEAATTYLSTTSLAVFERALEDYFVRRVTMLGTRDPLGVGIPLAYLWAKQNEVTNLRIIVKGKAIGLPLDRTRKELIVV